MATLAWLSCVLALAAPWALGGASGGLALAAEVRNPDGVAVIVGNKTYTEGPGVVAFAHRDAEAFRRYVIDVLGFDPRYVRVLNDASFGDMRLELGTPGHPGRLHRLVERRQKLNDGAAVSDVVVFYSGHGMPSLNQEKPGSYLLPVDADPHHPERDGYSVETLYEVVGALPARSVRVFLDACFTGVGGDGQQIVRGSPAAVTRLPEEVSGNTVAFTAAKANQIAYWDDEAGHGMFTQHVLDALYGGSDSDGDGAVTAREVERYLQEHLWHAVLDKNGREQDAVLLDGTGTGATVLTAAPADGAFPARPRLDAPDAGRGERERAGGSRDADEADPARIVLADGYTVADWALLAEMRLEQGEHIALLAEANRHIRTHGALAPLEEVREHAIAGLLADMEFSTKAEARDTLTRLARIAAAAGERPDLLRQQARAHRRLEDHASAAAVYERWLQVAAQTHPERREVLSALSQARRVIAEGERFAALLGRPFSADTVEESVGWTDLHYTASLNLPAVVAALIDAGMAADVRLNKDSLPIGDDLKQTLRELGLGRFAYLRARGQTPLMIAAAANASEAVQALLAQGADIGATDDDGETSLHDAAQKNARETAEWLVAQGADVQATDNYGNTPLHDAAWVNARETAEWLVAHGADIEARDNGGDTPLHEAAQGNSRETAEWLVAHGADIEARDNGGDTPLHEAAQGNSRETAEWLVAHGADIEARDNGGDTPLHDAAWRNARETAEWLVAHGADIEARDNGGYTPLHNAARWNARETVEWLVARGADIAATENRGQTPLDSAACGNARQIAEILVAHGADINATNEAGETPLHIAAWCNARETSEWLVSHGVHIEVQDDRGEIPLHEAAMSGAQEMAEWLVARGAKISARNNHGSTPLHNAAWGISRKMVEWLVARGADINATNNGGKTPLDYAVQTSSGDAENRAATQVLLRRLGGKTADELK